MGRYLSSTVLLPLICLLGVGYASRIKRDSSSLPTRGLAQLARHARKVITSGHARIPAMQSRPSQAASAPTMQSEMLFRDFAAPAMSGLSRHRTTLSSALHSRQFHASNPLDTTPRIHPVAPGPEDFEGKHTARILGTNEECLIRGVFSTLKDKQVMECWSKQDVDVKWVPPEGLSLELGYKIPIHNGADANGKNFELGDRVSTMTGKQGYVRSLYSTSGSHLIDIDFDDRELRSSSWYPPYEVKRA